MARSSTEDTEHELVTLSLVIVCKAVQYGGRGMSAIVLGRYNINTEVRALIVRPNQCLGKWRPGSGALEAKECCQGPGSVLT